MPRAQSLSRGCWHLYCEFSSAVPFLPSLEEMGYVVSLPDRRLFRLVLKYLAIFHDELDPI
jgi:hypothetical protein